MEQTIAAVDRWVAGWSISRGAPRERFGRGWRVEVAAETRSREYIIGCPSPEELRQFVSATAGRPDVWLSIVGEPDEGIRETVSALSPVTRDEMMMTSTVVPAAMPTAVILEQDGSVVRARIELEGEIAASGQAAVHGSDVVLDRIGAIPRFRRRGLASLIVTALASWAADRGATTGLLVASVEGRHLYGSLGWTNVSPIATFRGREL